LLISILDGLDTVLDWLPPVVVLLMCSGWEQNSIKLHVVLKWVQTQN
jgi:hypothetical protein